MNNIKWCVCVLLLSTGAFAQQQLPQAFVAAGGSVNYYATPAVASSWVSLGLRVGSSNLYSFSTLDMLRTSSSVRTGAAYVVSQHDNWLMAAVGDAGALTSTGATLGSFSGGGLLTYRFGRGGLFALGAVRVIKVTSTSIQPIVEIGFGKSF